MLIPSKSGSECDEKEDGSKEGEREKVILVFQVSSYGCDRGCHDHPAAGYEGNFNGCFPPPECLSRSQST